MTYIELIVFTALGKTTAQTLPPPPESTSVGFLRTI